MHLSQAGRLDIEEPPKKTRPKGAAVRIRFDNGQRAPRARARHRAQGRVVGARTGRRRPAREARSRARLGRVRRADPARQRQATDPHDPARPADGLRDRARATRTTRCTARTSRRTRRSRRSTRRAACRRCSTRSASRSPTRSSGSASATAACPSRKLGERFRVHNRAGTPCPECGDGSAPGLVRVLRGHVLPARARPAARSSPTAACPAWSSSAATEVAEERETIADLGGGRRVEQPPPGLGAGGIGRDAGIA